MQRTRYAALLHEYLAWAEQHPDVIGLAAVGSTSGVSREPDDWSDHDILVVTRVGTAAGLRADLSWVPGYQHVSLSHAETLHGHILIHDDGHLVELAIFEPDELDGVALEDCRVLLDRGGVRALLAGLNSRTALAHPSREGISREALALFTKHIVVGLNRYRRGELLSAHEHICGIAVRHVLALGWCEGMTYPHPAACLMDPSRRIEQNHPALAAAVRSAAQLAPPDAARALIEITAQITSDMAWLQATPVIGVITRLAQDGEVDASRYPASGGA